MTAAVAKTWIHPLLLSSDQSCKLSKYEYYVLWDIFNFICHIQPNISTMRAQKLFPSGLFKMKLFNNIIKKNSFSLDYNYYLLSIFAITFI